MGLQKGESGYAFRWLVPIFSLINALTLLGYAVCVTFFTSLIPSFAIFTGSIYTLVTIIMWFFAILTLTTAIIAFVMNKKGAYILGVIDGGIVGLAFLAYTVIGVVMMPLGKFIAFLMFFPIAAFAICVCVFSAVAIPKCSYDRTPQEKQMMGNNLTYVGFENDVGVDASRYHDHDIPGRFDPYAPPQPEVVVPEVRQQYVPQGPTGKITCTMGMYSGSCFDISDNEELVIGRDPRISQIVIGEGAQNVSREHCRILYNASTNSYSVKDMSKNGTYSAASRSKLPHKVYTSVPVGTEIYLGDRSNMFRLG